MSNTFFISDTHFGHKNIIKFDSSKGCRQFDNIEEHNEKLVQNWNSVVKKRDIVWHLGDFCFGKKNLEYASRLNGLKELVLGNHDTFSTESYLKYFHKVYGSAQFDGNILSHIPVHESQFTRWDYNIHGHLHSKDLDDRRYVNVSCEQINMTPISYEELKTLRFEHC